MRRLKSNQRSPTFTILEITQQWHMAVDGDTTTELITAILEQGASTGFFIFASTLEGVLSYGYSANMLRLNPKNKIILLDAPLADRVCLDPCNVRAGHCCHFVCPIVSNCCETQWKGTVAGGSLGACGASTSTTLFFCANQQTLFC
jgi:hypothetical protein